MYRATYQEILEAGCTNGGRITGGLQEQRKTIHAI